MYAYAVVYWYRSTKIALDILIVVMGEISSKPCTLAIVVAVCIHWVKTSSTCLHVDEDSNVTYP